MNYPASDSRPVLQKTAQLKAAAWTHPGRVRSNNEDRFYCDAEQGFFLVVDGVGGQAAGEVAASTALDFIVRRLRRKTGKVEERIREAIALANNEVYRLAQTEARLHGMACVLTLAVVENGQAVVGHVGDTRLYAVERGQIRKITHDHSPVGVREDGGELTEEEAMRHPRRNEIFRDVGSELHDPDDPEFVEVLRIPFEPEGALVLCSDGLSDLVPSAGVLQAVTRWAGDPEGTVRALIQAANEAGGKDNITVLVIEGARFAAGPVRLNDTFQPSPLPATGGTSYRVGSGPRRKSAWLPFLYGIAAGLLLVIGLQSALNAWGLLGGREPAPARMPRTLLVSTDSLAYPTIGAALEAALPGDVVEVEPGTYPEAVRLKNGVSLVSRQPRQAVIRPPVTPGVDTAAVVAIGIGGGRFSGFRIESAPEQVFSTGLYLRDAAFVVEDVEVSGMDYAGVVVDGTSTATLLGNSFSRNPGAGLVVRGQARPRVINNLILENGGAALRLRPGVEVGGSAAPVLEGNVIRGNRGGPLAMSPPGPIEPFRLRNFLD